jgi:hypothetical protein
VLSAEHAAAAAVTSSRDQGRTTRCLATPKTAACDAACVGDGAGGGAAVDGATLLTSVEPRMRVAAGCGGGGGVRCYRRWLRSRCCCCCLHRGIPLLVAAAHHDSVVCCLAAAGTVSRLLERFD